MDGRRLRVLLVDDDEDDYIITRDLLSEIEVERFDLDWVAAYEDALKAIGRYQHDVYLVDYRLGERNGLDLLREVLGNGCKAPMILLTGQGDRDVDVEAMKVGAADYLVKGQIEAPLLERSIRYALRRAQTLEALQVSQRFLQSTLDALSAYIAILDDTGKIMAVNAAWRCFGEGHPLIGGTHDVGVNYLELCESIPDGAEKAREMVRGIREVMAHQRDAFYLEYSWDAPNEKRWFIVRGTRFDSLGSARVVVAHEDITELKRTEEALRQSEEQLRQSQKMEAIGKLAGGVAHDFNNLLMPIMGYSDLLLSHLVPGHALRRYAEQIKKVAKRAASLTHQLLAFSRKQVLQLEVLDLNAVVADMNKMLRRLIGEDIDLITIPDPGLGRIKADPGQIEQVIMNLAVNARDAMPRGGQLTIETANVELDEIYAQRHVGVQPGPYVMLAMSDTGCGMDEETRSRVFEPFFTTKAEGQGTGLGLSTVYGIVRQSGGHIWVYSEPGRGATFKIYLPRIEEAVESSKPSAAKPRLLPQGSETVLVVEDEQDVRALICETLENDGYRILEACDGDEALLVSGQHPGPLHLMVTDVVMPGMSGRTLADCLIALRPGMKVLYMSGYTDNAIVRHGVKPGMVFLQKPFTADVLLRKVREILDARQGEQGCRRAGGLKVIAES